MHDQAAADLMAIGCDPLQFAETCSGDDVDIESGFFASLGLKNHLRAVPIFWGALAGAPLAP